MKRILIGLAGLIVVVAALGAGATWWLLTRFDARAEIVRRVEAATGRDFQIKGRVSVSVWPALGFRGSDVTLANAPGGAAPHMLTAKDVVIGVGLRPLFDRRLEVHEFTLIEPVVALEVDPNGAPNWVLQRATPPRGPQPRAGQSPVQTFSLHGLRMIDGRISYTNRKTRTAYALDEVDATADLDGADAPLRLEGEAMFRNERAEVDLTIGRFSALTTGLPTPVTLTLDSRPLNATLEGTIDAKTGAIQGDVKAKGPSLRGLAAWAGSPMGQGPGFEAFSISGRLNVGPRRYAFENASIEIDAIKSRGDFVVEQSAATPYLSGRLELIDADLNPYLAARPAAAGSGQVVTIQAVDVAAPSGWSEAPMDLSGLRAVNANLEITARQLRFQKLKVDRSQISFVLNNGFLVATMNDLQMYGGNGAGRFEVDARTPQLVIRNELAMQKLDTKAFLGDLIGFSGLEGAGKLEWGFTSRGGTQRSMMQSLTGAGSLTVAEGRLRGVNLGGVARTIRDAMRGEMVSPNAQTQFSGLTAKFKAVDGVIATDDLRLRASDAELTAIGMIDVGNRSLDLRLVPRLGGRGLVAVPFRMSGPWTRIGYTSDLLGRARAEVEGRARAVLARGPAR